MFSLAGLKDAERSEGGTREFKPLEPGVYIAKIENAEGRTANTGTEYVAIQLDVKDFNGANKGKLFYNCYLTDRNAFNVKQLFHAVEADAIYEEAKEGDEISPEQIAKLVLDSQVCIHTKIEESTWNGKTTNKAVLDVWGPMAGIDSINRAFYWQQVIEEGVDPDSVPVDEFINNGTDDTEEDIVW